MSTLRITKLMALAEALRGARVAEIVQAITSNLSDRSIAKLVAELATTEKARSAP